MTDVAQAKYAAGLGSQQDVLKVIVEATRLHGDVVDLEREARAARLRLNALLNRPIDAAIGALDEPHETVLRAAVDALQQLAAVSLPDRRAVQADVDRARASLGVAGAARAPDWSIGAGYMLQPRETDAWLARVSVSWPRVPWARRSIDARTAEATAAVRAAEADADARNTEFALVLRDAFTRVKAAEERAALLRTTLLPQSRQAVEVARLSYQAHDGDLASVIDGERMLLDAQLSYDQAIVEWRRAFARLERAVGQSLPPASLQEVAEVQP